MTTERENSRWALSGEPPETDPAADRLGLAIVLILIVALSTGLGLLFVI